MAIKFVIASTEVLVPFYRGAVVFIYYFVKGLRKVALFSSPFIEERLYLVTEFTKEKIFEQFSSPFIEERLYFLKLFLDNNSELVLVPFYRGAVVFAKLKHIKQNKKMFSSPFIEERLYLHDKRKNRNNFDKSSRPLLSRSGCIWCKR